MDDSKSDPILEHLYSSRSFRYLIWSLFAVMVTVICTTLLVYGWFFTNPMGPNMAGGWRMFCLQWGVASAVGILLVINPVLSLSFSRKLQ